MIKRIDLTIRYFTIGRFKFFEGRQASGRAAVVVRIETCRPWGWGRVPIPCGATRLSGRSHRLYLKPVLIMDPFDPRASMQP